MPVLLYFDVHVPEAIASQLRRRGVDVLRAQEDGTGQTPDDQLLERATQLGRVMFTQDIRFRVLAEDWQRQGKPFAGLLFGHQQGASIGQYVMDLEIIGKAGTPDDFANRVEYLPY